MVASTQPAASTQALAQQCVALLHPDSVYFQGHRYRIPVLNNPTPYLELAGKVFDSLSPEMQTACSSFVGDRFDLTFRVKPSSVAWGFVSAGTPLLFIPAGAAISMIISGIGAMYGMKWVVEGSQDYECRRDRVIGFLARTPNATEKDLKSFKTEFDQEYSDWQEIVREMAPTTHYE